MYWQARAILKKADLPWVWTLRGLYKSRGQDTSQWVKALKLIAASESACITAVSQAALDEVTDYDLVPPDKLRVIHNGIDASLYVSSPQQRQVWREKWNIPQDALVFGSAGRLTSVKRYDLALDAFAQLAHKNDHVYFVLAGDGELLQPLTQQAEALQIADRVRFLGYQSEIAGFLNMLDVFVLSSDSEGLPNVLLEAAAMDLPAISTAVGGVPALLDGTGILVPPNSVDSFAEAMRAMLSAEQRKLYSQKNPSIIQRFDMSHTAGEYKALYDELLERRQNRVRVTTS
jgi:glycosyltransferase involved in cell wall biosynthesis